MGVGANVQWGVKVYSVKSTELPWDCQLFDVCNFSDAIAPVFNLEALECKNDGFFFLDGNHPLAVLNQE
jgi:hypothetical protein